MSKLKVEDVSKETVNSIKKRMIKDIDAQINPYLKLKEKIKKQTDFVLNIIDNGSIYDLNKLLKDIQNGTNVEFEKIESMCKDLDVDDLSIKEDNQLLESISNLIIKKTYEYLKEGLTSNDYRFKVTIANHDKKDYGSISFVHNKSNETVFFIEFYNGYELSVKVDFNHLEENESKELIKDKINTLLESLEDEEVFGFDYYCYYEHLEESKIYKGFVIQFDDVDALVYIKKYLHPNLEAFLINTDICVITEEALAKVKKAVPTFNYKKSQSHKGHILGLTYQSFEGNAEYNNECDTNYKIFKDASFEIQGSFVSLKYYAGIINISTVKFK